MSHLHGLSVHLRIYINDASQVINDQDSSVLELKSQKLSLEKHVVQLIDGLRRTNLDTERRVLELGIEKINALIKSAKQAIAYKKLTKKAMAYKKVQGDLNYVFLAQQPRFEVQSPQPSETLTPSGSTQPAKGPSLPPADMTKEIRYLFRPKTNKEIADDYEYFKREFLEDEPGFVPLSYDGFTSKVYTAELATLLCGENITLWVQGTEGVSIKLNKLEQAFFAKAYVVAYQEGRKQFDADFSLSSDILYGPNVERYVMNLHHNCFHAECLGSKEGWYASKERYPRILTSEVMSDFGFYAGMLSRAEEVFKKHPFLFQAFAKCEHPKQAIVNTGDKAKKPHHPNVSTLEEMFENAKYAEVCLDILRKLPKPVLDSANNYIGKNKGIFPLWIKILQQHKPLPLIKPLKDIEYKDILNATIHGLKLTDDASEFRKDYKRLATDNVELDMRAILSQISQSGKLGK